MTDPEEWFAANRAMWDERVPVHVGSRFYDVDGFLAGRSTLRPFEPEEVGGVAGKDLVHLQCHFGLDTLSWARRGARVSGLDFSEPAVEAARAIAATAGLEATFVDANVYDAGTAFQGQLFDVVYTGFGALVWLPDIPRWAEVVAGLLRPGGFLYLAEFHPFSEVFGYDDLSVAYDYFQAEPIVEDESGTYTGDDAATANNRSYQWTHGLGEVVSSLIQADLRIEFLHERDYTLWRRWPFLEQDAARPDEYRLPAGMPRLPLQYSLRARKP